MSADDIPPTTDSSMNADRHSQASDLLKPVRQLVIFLLGISVLIVGIAMIVLPGPATVVIPAGLAILATEFVWARRWLAYLKRRAQDVAEWTADSVKPAANGKASVWCPAFLATGLQTLCRWVNPKSPPP